MPHVRRELIEPVHALKIGSPLVGYWKALEKTQFLPEEVLRQRQWGRLLSIIAHAFRNTAFYRQTFERSGVVPGDIRCPEDLLRLPLLTKQAVRRNVDGIVARGFDKEGLLRATTGGSTGTSLMIYKTEECSELKNACARRSDRWAGWEAGEPIGAVWGNPPERRGLKDYLKRWLLNPVIFLDTMHFDAAAVEQFARQWRVVRPTLLYGHAHSLYLLARCARDRGIDDIRPRGIVSTSMMLLPQERALMEEVFGVRVFDRYGCEEVSLIASECEEHAGLHLNIEHLYIEFIRPDGLPAAPGEEGRIVATDLLNYAMPLIRYVVDDIGVPTDRVCPCGRGLPLMERVVGRVADFLVSKDGGLVAGISLIERTLGAIPGIEQLQLIQRGIDELQVNLVPDDHFTDTSRKRLLDELSRALGGPAHIELRPVERLEQDRSGKYRFSISHVEPR